MNIKINLNLKELKKKHENNKNQVIFHTAKCKDKKSHSLSRMAFKQYFKTDG